MKRIPIKKLCGPASATLAGTLLSMGFAGAQTAAVPLTSGLQITHAVTIAPGTYALNDEGKGVARISGRDFVVDMRGAKLRGVGTGQGIGLHITDARNVTVKNADVRGCLWGIVIERSIGVKLINCDASYNADLPPGTVIDESGRQPEDEHGGGILIRDSANCQISGCTASHQWDGIDVIRSDNNVIENGDFSYNGNWGLHLWDSSRNRFRRNRAIWCTTGEGTLYQALTGWQTYDAQAVGIDHNSNENVIEDNDLRFGGDAIFIRANEGPLVAGVIVPPRNGSHRNVLRGNDCSFSPNNAIEVDFADDTVIENNNCSFSNYGMWLGYSRRCKVRGNLCLNDSSKAIEIENGQNDVFEGNLFGVDTPRPDQKLIYLRQNGRDKTPSGPYAFKNNVYYGVGEYPIQLKDTFITIDGDVALEDSFLRGMMLKAELYMPLKPKPGEKRLAITDQPLFQIGPDNKPALQTPVTLKAGQSVTLKGANLTSKFHVLPNGAGWASVAEIEGIPVRIERALEDQITITMPPDLWNRPAHPQVKWSASKGLGQGGVIWDHPVQTQVKVRVFNGLMWSDSIVANVSWPADNKPRIDVVTITPDYSPASHNNHTLYGANFKGEGLRVLFNNKPGTILNSSADRIIVRPPESEWEAKGWNIVVQHGTGENTLRSWPVTYIVPRGAAD